jgi:hypothetical protein
MDIVLNVERFYQPAWLSKSKADALLTTLEAMSYRVHAHRKHGLKRAPMREFYLPFPDGSIPLYRWRQSLSEYTSGRPVAEVPQLDVVRRRIAEENGEYCNHCIVIEYADGERHHAPPHHGKHQGVSGDGARDMAAGASSFVVTLGHPRPFQLLDEDENLIREERLPHGSLFQVTAEMPRDFFHAVPRDPTQPSGTPPYSAIFHTIRVASRQRKRAK